MTMPYCSYSRAISFAFRRLVESILKEGPPQRKATDTERCHARPASRVCGMRAAELELTLPRDIYRRLSPGRVGIVVCLTFARCVDRACPRRGPGCSGTGAGGVSAV